MTMEYDKTTPRMVIVEDKPSGASRANVALTLLCLVFIALLAYAYTDVDYYRDQNRALHIEMAKLESDISKERQAIEDERLLVLVRLEPVGVLCTFPGVDRKWELALKRICDDLGLMVHTARGTLKGNQL